MSVIQTVAEITMGCPAHQGLGPCEINRGVEPLNHRCIAIAGQDRTKALKTKRAIHFRKAAAGDIELKNRIVGAKYRERECAATLPALNDLLQLFMPDVEMKTFPVL